ncbi:MAG TPA: NADP-dependent oxidoreductase [Polyangiales bacterium]|nr:NADP-dependent oxidoreductase [Polyangiales bacterium]
MKAVSIHAFGGPEVLELAELDAPTVRDREVLIRVRAASINPVDYKTRAGHYPPVTERQLPKVLGRDVAGIVEQTGTLARRWKNGDELYAMLDQEHGGYAQSVAVRADLCARKPRNLSFAEAAAVPLAGLTAWQGLFDHGRLESGQTVLIHGGAGGVGHFAVQFAKVRGARVITTVSERDLDFVRKLGADQIIDRDRERFDDIVRDVDLVLDLIAGDVQERSMRVIKPGGALVSTLSRPDRAWARQRGVRVANYLTRPDSAELSEITQLIEMGKVRPYLQATFGFADVKSAQSRAEHEHPRGKIVLDMMD